MKSRGLLYVTFLLFIAVTFGMVSPAEAVFSPERWQKYCSIKQGDTASGYALVELPPRVYHLASLDLRDLRVVRLEGNKTEEVPYDIVSLSEPVSQKYSVTIINQGVSDTKSTATVFLGDKAGIHNYLEIRTPERDFIKEVTIEGSENKSDWVKLDSSGKIADVTASGEGFRKTGVTYSPTDYRYLRITLTGAGKVVSIDGVDILFKNEGPTSARQLPMTIVQRESSDKEKSNSIILTSGFDNLELHTLVFSIDSVNFSREIMVFASRDMNEWSLAGEGKLESLEVPGSKQSTLSLQVNSPGYRYLKVVIRNGDNPPLKILRVDARYSPDYILFPYDKEGSLRLYLSNTSAKVPEYDIASLSSKIMAGRPPVWSISDPQDNPLFKPEVKTTPESEKHAWLLPVIMALLVAVLGVFIVKSLPHVTKNQ